MYQLTVSHKKGIHEALLPVDRTVWCSTGVNNIKRINYCFVKICASKLHSRILALLPGVMKKILKKT